MMIARHRIPSRLRQFGAGLSALGMLLYFSAAFADDVTAVSRNVIINRVGFTSDLFPGTATRDAEIAIDYWFKLMSDRQNLMQIPHTKVFPGIDQMYESLKADQLDIVVILTTDYLDIRDEIRLEPFTIATRSEDGLTRWGVYVSRKSGIQTLEELDGSDIIFDRTEGASLGRLWFETLLLRKGILPSRFFRAEEVDKASRAILPVFFGQAKACVAPLASFENMVEMNPRLGEDLVAIELSPRMAPGIICFTDEIDPSRKPDIFQTLITMHEDPQGQQVLNLFRRDRVLPYEESQIEPVKALLEERELLRSNLAGAADPRAP